jgi:hypothetical protein
MMKPFEHTGFWWDPRDPGTRWPGTLRFDPATGAVLTRTIAPSPQQFFSAGREFDILLGESAESVSITLIDCYERDYSEVFPNAVIVGFHADNRDPQILVAAAVIEHLGEGWGPSFSSGIAR